MSAALAAQAGTSQGALPPAPVVTPEDRLALTFSVALLVHGALILGVSFVAPERIPPEYLDVILVQQADPTPNPEAELLAQANNQGGGDAAEEVTPSAPFEAPLPAPTPEVVMAQSPTPPAPESPPAPTPPPEPVVERMPEPEALPPEPVAEVVPEPLPEVEPEPPVPEVAEAPEPEPQPSPPPPVLATEAPAEVVVKKPEVEPKPEPAPAKVAKAKPEPAKEPEPEQAPAEVAAAPAPARPPRQPSATTLMTQSFETASLNAEIQQKLESHSQRPRRKFISASTRDYKYAAYMEAWRAKVERVGNLNYPDAAREQGLSGALILDVALRPDGSVQEIIVRKSSGHKVLDDAAVHIVEMAAPFAPFPRDFLDEVDILHVTRTWQFLNNYRFSSR